MRFRSIRKNWAIFLALFTGGISVVTLLGGANAVYAPGN
jgi:hypothetical protein